MKTIPQLANDESEAIARTFLNWQRTALALLGVSLLAIKLIGFSQNPLNLVVAGVAFIGSLSLSIINLFFFQKINTISLILLGSFIIILISFVSLLEVF